MSYKTTVLADSPVMFLGLNESSGTVAADSSTGGNPGTYTGTYTLNQTGPANGLPGVLLDGSTGTILVNDRANLDITGSISLEVWAKPSSYPGSNGFYTMIAKGYDGTSQPYFLALASNFASTPSMTFGFYNASIDPSGYISTATLPPLNQWTHIVGTWDGADLRLYYNGSLIGSPQPQTIGPVSTNLQLGIGSAPGASGRFFPGLLTLPAVYPSALSQSRILAHYQASVSQIQPNGLLGILGD